MRSKSVNKNNKNNKKNKKILIILLGIVFLFSIFQINKALASEPTFKLVNATIDGKSDGVNATINSFTNNTLDSDVEFHRLNEFVRFKLTIRNTSENDYTVKIVTDNNSNAYVTYTYDDYADYVLESGNNMDVLLTATYTTELTNINNRSQDNEFNLSFQFIDENGNVVEDNIIVNPKTNDNLMVYIFTAIISFIVLLYILGFRFNKKNSYLLLLLLFIPAIVYAVKASIVVTLANDLLLNDKMIVTYEDNGHIIQTIVNYGEKYERPEDPSKPGYDFDNWYLGDEVYNFDSDVVTDRQLTPKFNIKTYNITYDYGDASPVNNKATYTVETNTFTLVNPTLQGYEFAGWTEGNSTQLVTSVTIAKGTTGNKTFTAHFVPGKSTPYKVIHRFANLNGTYDVEEQSLTGVTGTTVYPQRIERTGYDLPTQQSLEINANGNSSITYTYELKEYMLTLNNIEDITTTAESKKYPHGTQITVTAKNKDGYTFTDWGNGVTTSEYTFTMTGPVELTPNYSINQYVVSFNSNGGTSVTNITRNYNQELGTLPTPTKNHYTFEGWYSDSTLETKVMSGTKVTDTMQLSAKWIIDTHTVTFNSTGGTEEDSINVDYNNPVGTLPTPTRINYSFQGWYTQLSGGDEVTNDTLVTDDVTYYAHWTTTATLCRKATELHTATCDSSGGCYDMGYSEDGLKHTSTITYGNIPSSTLTVGDAYDCDVNGDGTYNKNTERFYYIGTENGNAKFIYSSGFEGEDGPQNINIFQYDNALTKLPNVDQWSNIPVIFGEDKVARLIKRSEVLQACTTGGNATNDGDLNACVFLFDGTRFENEATGRTAFWLQKEENTYYRVMTTDRRIATIGSASYDAVRPVVEIPLDNLDGAYMVKFNANGGEVTPSAKRYESEGTLGELPTPTKENYIFDAWYSVLDWITSHKVNENTVVSGDMELFAHWKLMIRDAEIENTHLSVVVGNTVVINITNRDEIGEDYTFTSSDETIATVDGNGVITGVGEGNTTITITGVTSHTTKTVTVNSGVVSRIVTFNSKGGTTVNNRNVNDGSKIGTLPTATRDGYKFDGWYTEETSGTKITSDQIIDANVTYYAHWIEINRICKPATTLHTQTCQTTGGCSSAGYTEEGSHNTTTITYGQLPSSALTVGDAYDCDVNGDGTYDSEHERFYYVGTKDGKALLIYYSGFEGEDEDKNENIFPYDEITNQLPTATQWSNLPVTFDNDRAARVLKRSELMTACTNGSSGTTNGSLDSCEFLFETSRFESSSTGRTAIWLEKEGTTNYRIMTTDRRITTVKTDSNNAIRPVIEVPLENISSSVLVRFNANSGTVNPDTKSVVAGETIGTFPTATRVNYTLEGWYTEPGFVNKVSASTVISEDTTLYAKWERSSYTVTYHSNGGSEVAAVQKNLGDTLGTLPTSTKEHYTLEGWYTELEFENKVSASTTVQDDMDLYAKWTIDSFEVTFNSNGGSDVASITRNYNQELGTLPTPTKEHYHLEGWYTEPEFENKVSATTKVTDTMELYAKWEIDTHTVTFHSNGGSNVASITRNYNQELGDLPTPTNGDYTFEGWYTEATFDNAVTNTTKVTSDMDLYAKWELGNYTVTFHSNGGSSVASIARNNNEELGELPTPEYAGHTLEGWYTESTFDNKVSATTKVTSDMDLYAKWNIDSYIITYHPNGGSNVASVTRTYNQELGTLPSSTRNHYTLEGWYTESTFDNKVSATTKVTSDMDLYANWTIDSFEVSFHSNGGSSVASITRNYNQELGTLPTPTKEHYHLEGWYTEDTFDNKVTATTKVTDTMELYAKWEIDTHEVTFHPNGGSNVASIIRNYNQDLGELPISTYTGHTLEGWYTEDTFANKVSATTKVTDDMDLYANWTTDSYTVTYHPNGGSEVASVTRNYDQELGTLPTSTKEHYHLEGWYTEDTFDNKVSATTKVTSALDLYAKWEIDTHEVTFHPNGGSDVASITRNYNQDLGELPTSTYEGHTLEGWYTESTFDNKVSVTTKVTSDMDLYAKWTTDGYEVTFNSHGGSSVASVTRTYNQEIGELPSPTKDGYKLVGWFTEEEEGTQVTATTKITGPVTFHARWEEIQIICKKATTLRKSTCQSGGGCLLDGYSVGDEIVYGNIPSDTLTYGDAYDCAAKLDSNDEPVYERFYYIGTEGNNAKFIYYYGFDGTGPHNLQQLTYQNAIDLLPTRSVWNNLPVAFDEDDNPKVARLMTRQELLTACQETRGTTDGDLNNCSFFFEGTRYESSAIGKSATILAVEGTTYYRYWNTKLSYATTNATSKNEMRPVIEIPLENIDSSLLVRFNANDGTVNPTSKSVKSGDKVGTLPTPERDGYIFDGWYTSSLWLIKVTENTVVNESAEYVAKWKKSISLANITNEEISLVESETETIDITNSAEIEEEYTFTSNNESVATVDENGVVTAVGVGSTTITIEGETSHNTKTVSVTVQEATTEYTVTFHSNGGDEVTPRNIIVNHTIGELPTPEREGYVLVGWYKEEGFVNQVSATTKVTSDMDLYARWIEDDTVAIVNGTEYKSLNTAISEGVPTTGVKTEVIVYKNTSASFTLPSTKNVKLNLQGHILTNSGTENLIVNEGRLEITNGTLTSGTSSGTINNNSNATLVINGATIENTDGKQAIYNNGGTLEVKGSTTEIKSSASDRAALHNHAGTVTILEGTITSTGQNAVQNEATMTIGVKDGNISKTSPVIQGKKYGILASSTIKFNDGIAKGETGAVSGTNYIIVEEPKGIKTDGEDGSYHTFYLETSTDILVTYNPMGGTTTTEHILIGVGSSLGNLPSADRPNYDFLGWFTEAEDGTQIDENTIPDGDTTYFAQWLFHSQDTVVSYNITSDAMKVYYNNIASWKTDTTTFQSNMDTNFNNYNCSACTGPNYQSCPAPTAGKTLCDQPKGYNTGVTDSEIKVYESDETTKAKGDEVTYATITNGTIYNLIPGQTYYWESATDSSVYGYVKINAERRTISSNVRNVRDLGGLELDTDGDGTADGKLKYGRLYRGARLDVATDVAELEKLGITEEIDLRGSESDPKLSTYVPISIKNYLIYHDEASHASDYATFRQAVANTMQDIIDGKNIYFHCKIGTDRTGTMAYFLEGLLGVSFEDKLEDYELSYFYGLLNRHRLHDYLSGSSINPRFKSMYEKYDTNEKIYEWFMAAATTDEEIAASNKLIEDFRNAMIDKY